MTRPFLIATLLWAACASSPPPPTPAWAPAVTPAPAPEPTRDDVADDFRGLYLRVAGALRDDGPTLVGPAPTLVRHRCGYGAVCRPSDAWSLEFSRPLLADDADVSWVRVTPPVADLQVRAGSRWLTLRGTIQPETTYTVALTDKVRSIDGAAFAPTQVSIQVGQAAAALWTDAPAIVVQDPAAQSALTVQTSNGDTTRVARYAVHDADWPAFLALRDRLRRTGRLGPIPGVPSQALTATPPRQQIVVVRLDADEGGTTPASRPLLHWVETARLGVDVVSDGDAMAVWVTDARGGLPVPGAAVALMAGDRVVRNGTTGPDGVARISLAETAADVALRLVVNTEDDRLMVPDRVHSWDLPSVWRRRTEPPSRPSAIILPTRPPARPLATDQPWFAGEAGHLAAPRPTARLTWNLTTGPSRWRPPYDARFRFGLVTALDPITRRVVTAATAGAAHRLRVGFESVASEQPVALSVQTDVGVGPVETLTAVVHPADRYVGVRPVQRVLAIGEPVAFEVVVVDTEGATRLGAPVSLTLARERWDADRNRWVSEVTDRPPCAGLSANHVKRCEFGALPEGRYRATARVVDARDRVHAADADVWVLGVAARDVPPLEDPAALWMTTDPLGDVSREVARLAVVGPFVDGRALVVVDRDPGFDVRAAVFDGRLLFLHTLTPAESAVPSAVHILAVAGGRHASGSLMLGGLSGDSVGERGAPGLHIIRSRDRGRFP